MSRTWVYDQLSDAGVTALTPGGVSASTALRHAPHEKPFIMYRQTSDRTGLRGDDSDLTRVTGYMIFVHDVPGDYLQIDAVIEVLKGLFKDVVDQANNIIRSTWVSVSEDLRDEDMGTIMKFVRIQLTERS